MTEDFKKTIEDCKYAIILNKIKHGTEIKFPLTGADDDIKEEIAKLLQLNLIKIDMVKLTHKLTDKGIEFIKNLMKCYYEFKDLYTVFQRVNLNEGKFALSEFENYETDEEWRLFYDNLDRNVWLDLQINIAIYNKLDPYKLIFMSLIDENTFGNELNWQFDVHSELFVNKITEIYKNNYIEPDKESDPNLEIYNDTLKNVYEQGKQITLNYLSNKLKSRKEKNIQQNIEYYEEIPIYEEVYEIEVYETLYINPYNPYWIWY